MKREAELPIALWTLCYLFAECPNTPIPCARPGGEIACILWGHSCSVMASWSVASRALNWREVYVVDELASRSRFLVCRIKQ